MATIISANEIIPYAADDLNIVYDELLSLLEEEYFIVARTVNGARWYSEDLRFEDTTEMFQKYCAMVQYFDGGIVSLYRYTDNDYELVRDKVIF